MKGEYITKDHFDKTLQATGSHFSDALRLTEDHFNTALRVTRDYFDAAMRENTREIIGHFNKGQVEQNKRIDELEAELKGDISRIEIVLEEYLNTDKTVVTLVHELQDDHHLALPKTGALLVR